MTELFTATEMVCGEKKLPCNPTSTWSEKVNDFNVSRSQMFCNIHTGTGPSCPLTKRICKTAKANTLYMKSIVKRIHIEQLTNSAGSERGR